MTTRSAPVLPLPTTPRTDHGRVDLDAIVATVRRDAAERGGEHQVRLLESVPGAPAAGRWSYVVAQVGGRLTWWDRRGARGSGQLRDAADAPEPFAALALACELLGLDPHDQHDHDDGPPFTGGLIGGFSYDLVRAIERVPERAAADRDLPWFDLAVADVLVAIDHLEDRALVIGRTERCAPAARQLAETIARTATSSAPSRPAGGHRPRPTITSLPRTAYLRAVATVLDHIAAGDTFQVNLTQRLTTTWDRDGFALYHGLRSASPAPYGAVLPAGDHTVASISPETFLDVSRGRATVRPIKGTRPRHDDARADERARDELAGSTKDRAENVMVVDMERNDLGRVCRPGSVRVERLCDVEAHPTVWHLVSEVTGQLRRDAGYAELLRATFPCGSVTGTPKVRALELIEGLEPVRRGWYCGALGFLGHGSAALSVAIRTAVLGPDGTVDYGAGGGIVADSEPEAEHRESLDKAVAFLRAVGAHEPLT